eukprot:jgi/Phyca11/131073/e_gw1.100.103.1
MAADKKILYVDETNFNLWISRSNGWSVEGTRAPFKWESANEFIRCMLRAQAAHADLTNVVVVLDNTPCYNRAETVFEEEEFAQVDCLRLGLYSPMLNGIENVFSVYKTAVKRYMAVNRHKILDGPQGITSTAHRSTFLLNAVNNIFREVVTSELCRKCIHPSLVMPF